jgi:predicted nucleotidyltransferase
MIANEMDIRWIVERIVALYSPDRIYLFGSYARGTAHEGSDYRF